ncbi:MAG: hypothetical protein ACYCYO_17225 [Bacilli bacterium]
MLGVPHLEVMLTSLHTVCGNGCSVLLMPAVLPKPFASFWPTDFQGSSVPTGYVLTAHRQGSSANFSLAGSSGLHLPGRNVTVHTKFGPGALRRTANSATIAFVAYGTTFMTTVSGLGAINSRVSLEIVDDLMRVQ